MSWETGQRVVFRSLQWDVEDASSESVLVLFGRDRENRGQRIRVVPGLEPVARAEVSPLEWTLGRSPKWDPLQWRALQDAFRLTMAHGRGSLASVDWGRLILEPYQLVPLQRVERLPFPRLLIADDTGLGKTAEAGLILFRLLQKRRADRVLILCRAQPEPERWQLEMREKFGVEFQVINDGADFARLRREVPSHLNVFGYLPRIVMSMYFAAPSERGSRIVDDLQRVRWDLVIIDEAHHVAERGDSAKKLAELGRVVADSCDALLLLTATPHDGKAESFASLLRLIDPYLVIDPERLDPALVRPVVVRRLKPNVVKCDGSRFLRRRIQPLAVEPTKAENWLDKGLRGYCKELRTRARQYERAGERSRARGASFLETFLRRRLASSAFACRESLRRRLEVVESRAAEAEAVGVTEDVDDSPVRAPEFDLPSGRPEADVLRDLVARAERIPEGAESKAEALLKLTDRILSDGDEKVIVFTEFVDSLELLARVFSRAGWDECDPMSDLDSTPRRRFCRYEGSTPKSRREATRRLFLERADVRLLLATDAAAESINLHSGCNNLVHLEAVWNPNRYEQRNGRIDRYGQTREPRIYLLINSESIDERVASVGFQKLERIADHVGSVSNVLPLASRIDVDEFLDSMDPADISAAEKRMESALTAAEAASALESVEDGTADFIRGDPFAAADQRAVEEALSRSREFVPEFTDVEAFLRVFLRAESGGIEPTSDEPDVFRIRVPAALEAEVGARVLERATFRRDLAVKDPAAVDGRCRLEFLSPGHPLVRAALRHVRAWVHQPQFASRVSYRRVAAGSSAGLLFTFAERFIDGRGEAIEERFDAVLASLDGDVSGDGTADMRRFLDPGVGGNATSGEQRALTTRFAEEFTNAFRRATDEARRRAATRCAEIAESQRAIATEALVRLGQWKAAAEDRLRRSSEREMPPPAPLVQLDLAGDVARELARKKRDRARKLARFEDDARRLLAEEDRRRREIALMESIRLDSLDAIGALALVPEGFA